MSKPREYWVCKDSYNLEGVFYAWNGIPPRDFNCIKVIEKDAADKLAVALEKIDGHKILFQQFRDSHYIQSISDEISKALAEYRGTVVK